MAKVRIVDVTVLDNPSKFFNPFQFQITFECTEDLSDGKNPTYIFMMYMTLASHSSECLTWGTENGFCFVLFRRVVCDHPLQLYSFSYYYLICI